MTIGEGWNEDRLVNQELCLQAQLPLHQNRLVQLLQCCQHRTNPLHFPITLEQDPEILKLFRLGQRLISNPEGSTKIKKSH